MNKSIFYRNIMNLKMVKINKNRAFLKNVFLFFARILLLIVPLHTLITRIIKLAKTCDFNQSSFVGCIVWGYGKRERCNKSIFKEFILCKFEDENYRVMVGYKEYLTNLYGDYMQLPSKEERIAHHSFTAYLK